MITFITWLRFLAAVLITNAHYTGIYPTDLIANGGLIGDIIFFCVSGYCLTNIKTNFCKWYGRRVIRIFPTVIFISALYLIIGQYDFSVYASGTEGTLLYQILSFFKLSYPKWLSWLAYPTYYHFVASIIVLYVPYYFIIKCKFTKTHIPMVMGAIFAVYLVLYIFIYDKSAYHIDVVREPFIRFLFMESMLLGAFLKQEDAKLRNTGKPLLYMTAAVITFVLYFAGKVVLTRGHFVKFQIVNQLIIFALLFFVMRWFSSIDRHLEKAPKWLFKVVDLIAKLTLEIYLVQYVLIDFVRDLHLVFPLNWIVLTSAIILSAFLLHAIFELVPTFVKRMAENAKNRKAHNENTNEG